MIELSGQTIYLGDGNEDDLEYKLYEYMVSLAKEEGIDFAVANHWGENTVVIGGTAYEVQWQYVGLEPEEYNVTDDGKWIPIGPWSWNDDEPDFEVSSYWCDR
ncbi:hypothetical protein MM02_00087 [Escherichia phage vB_EcoM_MM02]|uniref:Uncharacterized protein n=1 Tax=Escherichia phage vB_EcoM_MM02 TaxID=2508202 RepID=A0A482MYA3_9CAUD|nr:hypothetical protein MM02_00087 [Escherichia phage vB_EcoM_MM02]